MIDFDKSILKGKVGEKIFQENFLDFLGVEYENVTNQQAFRVIDTDFKTIIGMYEIKNNYKDNEVLIIEEYTNINPDLGNISLGWLYKSKADVFAFVSQETKTIVLMPFTDKFKKYYSYIRENTELNLNGISQNVKGNRWQSAFRRVPFDMLDGYISIYKLRE